MSIRAQITSLLVGLSIFFVATTWMIQAWVMMPAFEGLEREIADRNLNRCIDAINTNLHNLSGFANDWGAWDDTSQFVQDQNDNFRQANLIPEMFTNTDSEFACFLNADQQVVWGRFYDLQLQQYAELPELMQAVQSKQCTLHQFSDPHDSNSGIVNTTKGPMLLAARPITTSKHEGPVRGTVIFGRLLTVDRIASPAERTHLDLQIWPVNVADLPVDAATFLANNPGNGTKQIINQNSDHLLGMTLVSDLLGNPAAIIRIQTSRTITAQGHRAGVAATLCSLAAGLLTLLVTGFVLRKQIAEPLQLMANHVSAVGTSQKLPVRPSMQRTDEIGTLASSFDEMVERLAESSLQLQDAARQAGMAEIASEVLHNIGNAVNSASSSVQLLEERLAGSKLDGLEMAASILVEQAPQAAAFFAHDPRGPKLINYLSVLSESLQSERIENLLEVERLQKTIQHVVEVLDSQHQRAVGTVNRQCVNLARLLDDVLAFNQQQLHQAGIAIEVQIEQLPELWLDRSLLTQVLVNLIRNARLSMESIPKQQHCLSVTAELIDDRLIMQISDTGAGIAREDLVRIFRQGFTTRADGSGIGLHYCANVIQMCGGQLTAHSDGHGTGATFDIQLPGVLPPSLTVPTLTAPSPDTQLQNFRSDMAKSGMHEQFQFS